MCGQLCQKLFVIFNIDNRGDKPMILRSSTDHRRAANVDVLDTGIVISTLCHGFFKRIKVHNQQVDPTNPMLFHCSGVIIIIAQRKQAAMYHWVQCFYTSIHHFWKPRHIRNIAYINSRIANGLRTSTSRKDFNATRAQRFGKINQSSFIRNRNKRAAHGIKVRHSSSSLGQPMVLTSSRSVSRTASAVSCALASDQRVRVPYSITRRDKTICFVARGCNRPRSK